MSKLCCMLVLTMMLGLPAWAGAEQMNPSASLQPPPGIGASFFAALTNVAYFPVRFAITLVTAEVGGFTGWMTGGNEPAAYAVWQSTEGQAYVQPEVLEGRQRLRFGRWH